MQWHFPVTAGSYEVRLAFAEIYEGAQSVGARVFDVAIEGTTVLDNYDVFANVGGYKGVVKSFTVSSDASLDITFGHVVENPAIKGIEILSAGAPNQLAASPTSLDFGTTAVGATSSKSLQLTNVGGAGDPSIVIDQTTITGTDAVQFADTFDDAANVTVAPGASTTISVSFTPASAGAKSATLQIADRARPLPRRRRQREVLCHRRPQHADRRHDHGQPGIQLHHRHLDLGSGAPADRPGRLRRGRAR
jgi:hypothetical protein